MVQADAGSLLFERSHIMGSVHKPRAHLHANEALPTSAWSWGSAQALGRVVGQNNGPPAPDKSTWGTSAHPTVGFPIGDRDL